MATYKKRGIKKPIKKGDSEQQIESTTVGVFESLDSSASKAERFVLKYQKLIYILIGLTVVGVLGFMGYRSFIHEPQSKEAIGELNQSQYYFNLAVNSQDSYSDSLYMLSIRGGEGKYGFDDIIENYNGTSAANLALFSAAMAYFNTNEYDKVIEYLEKFKSDDIILSAMSKGVIGDAYFQLDQDEKALIYYNQAIETSENSFTKPKYLFKAGLLSSSLKKNDNALNYFKKIKDEYSDFDQITEVDIQISRLENIK